MNLSHTVRLLSFLKVCDYAICEDKTINENSKVEAFNFRWKQKFISRRRLHGGGDYDSISDEENSDEEERENKRSDNDLEYEQKEKEYWYTQDRKSLIELYKNEEKWN
jgi:hypothetical protein